MLSWAFLRAQAVSYFVGFVAAAAASMSTAGTGCRELPPLTGRVHHALRCAAAVGYDVLLHG